MRVRAFSAIVVFLVFGGLASGQSYHVRVDSDTNLRDANRLDGSIVETIPAGTVLPVINWAADWLKVVRGRRRLWMADWVNYTLVEFSEDADPNTAMPATSDTQFHGESCCAVEWLCENERTRVSASWAFQFGRCHVETAYLKPDYRVYNCCFLGRPCYGDRAWRKGFTGFQNYQCKVRTVEIAGSDEFIHRMHQAFAMLKHRAPVWYAYAISGLDSITEIPETYPIGVHVRSRQFQEHASALHFDAPGEARIVWMASVLAHEACHVHLYEANVFRTTGTSAAEEKLCTEVQLTVADIIDPTDYFNDYLQTLIDNIHNPEYQWW
ncbi:MAG: SH3 domain-containing protein [Chloroflexota bacterium]|nr:SH3 domain-containing protein [Chloroflexota bacterium]